MAAATMGEEVSSTANGRLTNTETAKPSSTVLVVTSACQATLAGSALVSFQIAEGAGMMYAGTAKSWQAASHTRNSPAMAATGSTTSTNQAGSGRGSMNGVATGAEDEFTDSAGGALELI